jgi:hypothetical protein
VVDRAARGDVIVIGMPVAEIRPVRPYAVGFPATHWEAQKRYPRRRCHAPGFRAIDGVYASLDKRSADAGCSPLF